MTAGNERNLRDMKAVVLGMKKLPKDMKVLTKRVNSSPTAKRVVDLQLLMVKSKAAAANLRKDRAMSDHLVNRETHPRRGTTKQLIKVTKCTQIGTAIPSSIRRDGHLLLRARAKQLHYFCRT